MTTTKTVIDRKKVRLSTTANGNVNITDSNKSRRCSASCLKMSYGWNVRIDRFGIDGWKYLAGIQVETAEAAYEYCLQFGERVEG